MSITDDVLQLGHDARERFGRLSDAQVVALTAAWVESWDDLAPELLESLQLIIADAKDGRVSYAKVAKNKRLAEALELAAARAVLLADLVGETIAPDLPTMVTDASNAERAMIQAQLPPGVALADDMLDAAALDSIVARTTQRIHALSRPLAPKMIVDMKRELVRGIAVGNNPRETARRIMKRTEGQFNGGLTRALVIARTETIDTHRAAARMGDQAFRDVLDGWKWSAHLDGRTCVSCISKHGTQYNVDEPGPLDHHQGRCARIPLTKSWAELGFPDIEEPADVMPDAKAWFDGLTEDSQQHIMGKTRLAAYQDGRIGWDDLSVRKVTRGWRDSYHVATLKDLGLK